MAVKNILIWMFLPTLFLASLSQADIPLETSPTWQWDESIGERAVGALAWGDVDSDGDLDLAVGCYDASNWYPPITEYHNMVFLNNGGVLETTPSWVSGPEYHTGDMAFFDVNDDGYQDLVCGNGGLSFHRTCVYYGGPSGLSTTPDWNGASNYWSTWVFCGDVNGDGWMDLLEGNQGVSPDPYRHTNIYYNNAGTLSSTPSWQTSTEFIASGLYLGDVDNSGHQTETDHPLTPDGTTKLFYLPQKPLMSIDGVKVNGVDYYEYCYDLEGGWLSLRSAPGAGDSLTIDYSYTIEPDLVIAKWSNFDTAIYFHNGTTINTAPGWNTGLPSRTDKGVSFAFVDSDNYQDLLVGGNGDPCRLYVNDGGYYLTTIDWENADSFNGASEVAFGDVDGDGDMDLAVVNWSNGETRIYENISGTLNTLPDWLYDFSGTSGALAWGDMNGDGALDLAIGVSRDPAMVFLNTATLDITVTYFIAESTEEGVVLRWEYEGDEDVFFNIARTTITQQDGSINRYKISPTWINEAPIEGVGECIYLDEVPAGEYLYQLYAVTDGEENLADQTTICHDGAPPTSFAILALFPNPASEQVTVSLSLPNTEIVELAIYDIAGRLIMQHSSGELPAGEKSVILNTRELANGVYTLSASSPSGEDNARMVIIR